MGSIADNIKAYGVGQIDHENYLKRELVGEDTGEDTKYGKRIYLTPEGERVSELTATFPMDGGWVAAASVIDGKRYDEDELSELYRNGAIPAIGTYESPEQAENAMKWRSARMEDNYIKNNLLQEDQVDWTTNPQELMPGALAQSIASADSQEPVEEKEVLTSDEEAYLARLRLLHPDATEEELTGKSLGNTATKFGQSALSVTGNIAQGVNYLASETDLEKDLTSRWFKDNITAFGTDYRALRDNVPNFKALASKYKKLTAKDYDQFTDDEKQFWNSEQGKQLHDISNNIISYKGRNKGIDDYKKGLDSYVIHTLETYKADKTFLKTYEESGGGVKGTLDGMLEMFANDPAIAPVTFIENLPYMVAFAYGGPAVVATLSAQKDEENIAKFKEANNGREPTTKERSRIMIDSLGSVFMEKFGDKYVLRGKGAQLFNKITKVLPRTTRIVGSTITETISGAGSEAFDQDAVTQDIDQLKGDKIALAGAHEGFGGLGGGASAVARGDLNNPALLNKVDSIIGNNPGLFPNQMSGVSKIFPGAKAAKIMGKTEVLKKAEELEKTGTSADDIWKKTGFVRGQDEKWRFELDSSVMKLKEDITKLDVVDDSNVTYKGATKSFKLKDVIEYPELFKAYPELENLTIFPDSSLAGNTGEFLYKDHQFTDGSVSLAGSSIRVAPRGDIANILEHEIQHAVQVIEGHARGSSASREQMYILDGNKKYQDMKDKVVRLRNRLRTTKAAFDDLRQRSQYSNTDKEQSSRGLLAEELDKIHAEIDFTLQDMSLIEDRATPNIGYTNYTKVAGEAEGRESQNRLHMTAEERRELLPTWDNVSKEDAIVRFDTKAFEGDQGTEDAAKAQRIQNRLNQTDEEWEIELQAMVDKEVPRKDNGYPETDPPGTWLPLEELKAWNVAQDNKEKQFRKRKNKKRADFFKNNVNVEQQAMEDIYKQDLLADAEQHEIDMNAPTDEYQEVIPTDGKPTDAIQLEIDESFDTSTVEHSEDGNEKRTVITLPGVGEMSLELPSWDNSKDWKVESVSIGDKYKGKGAGVRVYIKAIEELLKRGDADYMSTGGMTTESAMRVWRSLETNYVKIMGDYPQLRGAFRVYNNESNMTVFEGGSEPGWGVHDETTYEQGIDEDAAFTIELNPKAYEENIKKLAKEKQNDYIQDTLIEDQDTDDNVMFQEAKGFKTAKEYDEAVKDGGYGNMSISEMKGIIDRNTKGALDFRKLEKELQEGGQSYFLTKVDPTTLKIEDLETVKSEMGKYGKDSSTKPIVVGKDGYIIDGRHRALRAINEKQEISAYVPATEIWNKAQQQNDYIQDNLVEDQDTVNEGTTTEVENNIQPLERTRTGTIDQMVNDEMAIVGGMRSGNSRGDETRRMYTIYDMTNMDEDFANHKEQEIGNIQVFMEDGTHKIRGIVDIKIPVNKRKQGHAKRIIETLVNSEFSNKPFKIYDIKKSAYPFWKKMGVTFVSYDFGKDISDKVGKRSRLKGDWGTVNAYIGSEKDIKKQLNSKDKKHQDYLNSLTE